MEVNTVPGLVVDESEDEGREMFGDVKASHVKVSCEKCENICKIRNAKISQKMQKFCE